MLPGACSLCGRQSDGACRGQDGGDVRQLAFHRRGAPEAPGEPPSAGDGPRALAAQGGGALVPGELIKTVDRNS